MKHERQFGGKYRKFLSDEAMANIAELDKDELNDRAKEVVELLREGFNILSDMQRKVILTLVDNDCTERKAADILGLHYLSFRAHLRRAQNKLKKYVSQNLEGSIYNAGIHEETQINEAESDNSSDFSGTNESH